MREYCIYQRCKSGKPYIIHVFNNIDDAKLKLYDMISLEAERGRPYFVDNDFYSNKWPFSYNGMYYCIQVREVTEYKKYSEFEYNEKNKNKSNIYFFNNYKKIL